MNKKSKESISPETVEAALKIAKATQRPGQTKEQTKLIAKGIEKGIAQFKKEQKAKMRERDKLSKKSKIDTTVPADNMTQQATDRRHPLPWILLAISWLGFATYIALFI